MRRISRAVDLFTNWLMIIAAIFAACIAFIVLFDIMARNMNIVFYGTAEYVRNMIVAIVFLWLPYCVKSESMLRMDFVLNAVPFRGRVVMQSFGYILGLIYFGTIAFGAVEPTYESWRIDEVEDRGLGILVPVWPARAAILFGCAAAALIYILRMFEVLSDEPGSAPSGARQREDAA